MSHLDINYAGLVVRESHISYIIQKVTINMPLRMEMDVESHFDAFVIILCEMIEFSRKLSLSFVIITSYISINLFHDRSHAIIPMVYQPESS